MPDAQPTFAEKLNKLFQTVTKPDGSKYTQEEVVRGTNGTLTRVYLWKLRTGRATHPGFHIVQALADFFGVEIGYFIEEPGKVADMADQARKDRMVDQIALRSSKLGEEGKKAILQMIEHILLIEQGNGVIEEGDLSRGPQSKS